MPKAEVGSTKYLNNRLKSKGLQRLRWYCQVCEKQCRDENGFKMHTQSESHVRQMMVVGENAKKYINDYSGQFQRDFLQLLRTAHGEKKVHLNHFYQEYISNKEHVHMNATRWPSLTEFAKFLGREGICRVEDDDKGLHIAWVDNSPEALRRQDAIRKKERQDKGDEEREQMLIREQVKRARMDAEARGEEGEDEADTELRREEGEKVKLNFGPKATPAVIQVGSAMGGQELGASSLASPLEESTETEAGTTNTELESVVVLPETSSSGASASGKISMKVGIQSKPKNVFAAAKKNALGGKKSGLIEQPRKMSEAERIMKEEMERKRGGGSLGFRGPPQKKQRS